MKSKLGFKWLCAAIAVSLAGIVIGASNSVTAAAAGSNAAQADSAVLYHKYFDLNDIQKQELTQRGYSDAQIRNMDSESFRDAEAAWKLTPDEIQNAKTIYPGLKNTDISDWTNADFSAYSARQDAATYAPTPDQAAQLQKRGISLAMARMLLKEYCTYDTMLAQTDATLSSMSAAYNQAIAEYQAAQTQKEDLRRNYLNDTESTVS